MLNILHDTSVISLELFPWAKNNVAQFFFNIFLRY